MLYLSIGAALNMVYGERYFTEFTTQKAIFYFLAVVYVSATCLVILYQPFVNLECSSDRAISDGPNPFYKENPCRYERYAKLLWMTEEECIFGRRLVVSVILGGIIGWERRCADRPAGIRTMSLVSLGSSLFTICSAYAFLSGPMEWDASRISAAIPSGVGFLGAGLIWKEAQKDEETGTTAHTVHGLTTAASLWLSSAVGIACGGGLYFAASFSTAIILVLLRFGPRYYEPEDSKEEQEYDQEEATDELNDLIRRGANTEGYNALCSVHSMSEDSLRNLSPEDKLKRRTSNGSSRSLTRTPARRPKLDD